MEETYADENGFTVEQDVSLLEWVNYDGRKAHDECIHVFLNERSIDLYRISKDKWEEHNENRRIKTTVDDVSIRCHGKEPSHFVFHSFEAATVLTFFNMVAQERSDTHISLEYYADNGKQLTEDSNVTEESLYMSYETETDRSNTVVVNSTYKNYMQMFGKN